MHTSLETTLSSFLKWEYAGGFALLLAALIAIVLANSPLHEQYSALTELPFEIRLGSLALAKPLLLWINDGLMTIFFFLIGLELKREIMVGELADKRNILLPALVALGGMAAPALIYLAINHDSSLALQGWAIPVATDIAFSLGILSLLGSRVPKSMRIFLTSIAVFDDLGAILIIAIFYTEKISMIALAIVCTGILILFVLNRRGDESKSVYVLVGIVMWAAMLKSGVHATLTGIIVAMFIPLKSKNNPEYSPLNRMEKDLQPLVSFAILPLFAFVNSGVSFIDTDAMNVFHRIPLGIALGLFVGKQIGIFGSTWVLIKLKIAQMPRGMSWGSVYGLALVCGVGFTMSLFIGALAYDANAVDRIFDERLGIFMGSIVSAVIGYLVLKKTLTPKMS